MNVPLLIELHHSGWLDKEKGWTANPFMVDVCHIEKIEPDMPGDSPYLTAEENAERYRRMEAHEPYTEANRYVPKADTDWYDNCSIVHYKGKEIKVIETYEEIREKIAKAGVVVP
ncbi:MAG: hypothetical protein IJ709_10655 [Selenomonas sp.]|nr:hypothetical protein [Selenomonas sp.]